jgi:hypothetical protein
LENGASGQGYAAAIGGCQTQIDTGIALEVEEVAVGVADEGILGTVAIDIGEGWRSDSR